jgi:hypothetical protein
MSACAPSSAERATGGGDGSGGRWFLFGFVEVGDLGGAGWHGIHHSKSKLKHGAGGRRRRWVPPVGVRRDRQRHGVRRGCDVLAGWDHREQHCVALAELSRDLC